MYWTFWVDQISKDHLAWAKMLYQKKSFMDILDGTNFMGGYKHTEHFYSENISFKSILTN